MGRIRYFTGRLIKSLILVALIAVLNFLMVRLAPGDPASVIAGESGAADPIYVEQLRKEFRLDEPLPVQLWTYLEGLSRLDLGYSYRNKATVLELLAQRLPATLLLMGVSFVLAVAGGIVVGSIAASFAGRWPDTTIGTACVILYATPLFWIGLMFILIFAATLNWLPAFGFGSTAALSGWPLVADRARHLVLPVLTLTLYYLTVYARLTRASMLEVGRQAFVRTAKAKGLPPLRIVRAHLLRNALLPVITFAGIHAGHLIGGSVLVETVFAWPGVGRLALDSLLVRDYNTLLGVFLLCTVMTIVFNLIADAVYLVADPRIELEQ